MNTAQLFFACAVVTFLAALFGGVFTRTGKTPSTFQTLLGFIWAPGLIATVILGLSLVLRVMTRL